METSEIALISAMGSALCEAVEMARAEALSLADLYVQVKYDEQQFLVYDDAENVLAQTSVDALDDWKEANDGEDVDAAMTALLRKVLSEEKVDNALRSLDFLPPFSVVLIDRSMETIAELITLDDENVYLHDDFWAKMDKELDDFFEQLMADTK